MQTTIVWRDRVYALALAGVVLVGAAAFGFANGDGGSSSSALTSRTAVPTATQAAQPTAVPSPTAPPTDDAGRIEDVRSLAAALTTYRTRFGAYPSTDGGTQWMCKTGLEAGCALARVATGLPFNDGTFAYLYRSDGNTYTLFTQLDTAVTTNGCAGVTMPAELAGKPAYCIGS